MVDLHSEQLEAIIERAAERGATKVLHTLGLQDDAANQDIAELRSWIRSVRSAKGTIASTLITALTLFVIGLFGIGLVTKLLNMIGHSGP